jgi:hypothetical protein
MEEVVALTPHRGRVSFECADHEPVTGSAESAEVEAMRRPLVAITDGNGDS